MDAGIGSLWADSWKSERGDLSTYCVGASALAGQTALLSRLMLGEVTNGHGQQRRHTVAQDSFAMTASN